jgi:hypothetical protein
MSPSHLPTKNAAWFVLSSEVHALWHSRWAGLNSKIVLKSKLTNNKFIELVQDRAVSTSIFPSNIWRRLLAPYWVLAVDRSAMASRQYNKMLGARRRCFLSFFLPLITSFQTFLCQSVLRDVDAAIGSGMSSNPIIDWTSGLPNGRLLS